MDKTKMRAAAISAVIHYIKSEEEALAGQLAAEGLAPPAQHAAPAQRSGGLGWWGASGRQAQMQMRNLMQMKSFHGAGLR